MEKHVSCDCWQTLQQSIDAVSAAGGGKVVVECNINNAHTIYLKSNVELHIAHNCTITGSADHHDYDDFNPPELCNIKPEKYNHTLIAAVNENNIAITGSGTLAIPGVKFYDESTFKGRFFAKPATPRPRILHLVDCNDVFLSDTLYKDAPCWTIWLSGCNHVAIKAIRIEGDQRMINNDGIDIDGCRDVTLSDCRIKTCDDCLVLRVMPRDKEVVCENVVLSNCVLSSACQGIRIGCPSDDIIRNCRFSNMVLNCPGNGINIDNPVRYLKEGCTGKLDLSNITIAHMTINSGWLPVRLGVDEGVKLRSIRNIVFDDIIMQSSYPCDFHGSSETVPENIVLRNVKYIQTAPSDRESNIIVKKCRRFRLENFEMDTV